MGLKIAIALIEYNDHPEPILDETYGRIVFTRWNWYEDTDGNYFDTRDEIPSHYCSEEEIGLDSKEIEENVFFPVA